MVIYVFVNLFWFGSDFCFDCSKYQNINSLNMPAVVKFLKSCKIMNYPSSDLTTFNNFISFLLYINIMFLIYTNILNGNRHLMSIALINDFFILWLIIINISLFNANWFKAVQRRDRKLIILIFYLLCVNN